MLKKATRISAVLILSAAVLLSFLPLTVLQPATAEDQGTGAEQSVQKAATETTTAGTYTFDTFSDGTAVITGYDGSDTSLIIPEKVTAGGKEYAVTEIGNGFKCSESVETINTNKVVKFGRLSNVWQSNVKSIVMPEVTEIGREGFNRCKQLHSVQAPKLKKIGWGAFRSCSSLQTLDAPSIENIEAFTFDGCKALSSINFSHTKTIGTSAFSGCKKLVSVELPEVVTIEQSGFKACSNLQSVSIPNAKEIGNYAFKNCGLLTGISFPKAVRIGRSIILNDTKIMDVEIPASIKYIGAHAFGFECKSGSSYHVIPGFKITCTAGTAGEKYVKKYGFQNVVIKPNEGTPSDGGGSTPTNPGGSGTPTNPSTPGWLPSGGGGGSVAPVLPSQKLSPVFEGLQSSVKIPVRGTLRLNTKCTSDATVFYLPQDQDVISISSDGVVQAKKAGSTTVFVLVPETAKYQASIKTFTVTVTAQDSQKENRIAKPKILSAKRKGTMITVTWKKQTEVNGYHVRYSIHKNMKPNITVKINSASKSKTTLKNVKKGRIYYVQVRTFRGKDKSTWSKKVCVK